MSTFAIATATFVAGILVGAFSVIGILMFRIFSDKRLFNK